MKGAFAAILILLAQCSFALDPNRAISQYVSNSWNTDTGLPENNLHAILQTRDGYLWVGTGNGLGRFDGVHFEVFDSVRVPELTAPEFFCLLEAPDGTLWIGSYWGGLIEYKNGHFRKFGKPQGLTDERIVSILLDRSGALWLGTPDGLFRMKSGKFERFWKEHGLPGRVVWSMAEDQEGKLWFATVGGGLYSLDHNKFIHDSAVTSDDILSLLVDHNNNLWVGTADGLFRKSGEKITLFTTKDGLASGVVRDLLEDRDENIWIAETTSLSRLHDGIIQRLTKKEGFPYSVKCLYEDREGTLWAGTSGGGLFSFRNGKVITFATEEGLAGDIISSVHANQHGAVWVGTSTGVSKISKEARGYTVEAIPTETAVNTLFEDSKGTLWVGLEDHGAYVLRKNKLEPFADNDRLASKQLWAIYEVAGDLWLGFFGSGISRVSGGKLNETFTVQNGLPTSYVQTFNSNEDGLLIATEDAGILRFENGKFSTYISQDALENQVFTTYFDDEKVLWMGSLGGGLKRYKNGNVKSIRRTDGLADDTIGDILQDANGNFWMDCPKGILTVSKKQLNDLADGKISRIQCTLLGKSDGMKSSEASAGSQPSAWKTPDGKLWFSSAKGVVLVDPARMTKNLLPPPVRVERLIVDNRIWDDSGANPKLQPGSEKLEFHYTALSFMDPAKVQFKYKLEGYDANWVDAGTRRVAFYTHIPAGQYDFRVIACNNDQVWNESGDSFRFYIRPHFYQTVWFYLFCSVAVVGIGIGLHRQRMNKANKEFAAVLSERARIAREIHDGLTQAMTGVVMQLETARLVPERTQAQKHLDRALELARKSVEDARRTVGDLRPKPFSSLDFPEGLRSLVQYQLRDSVLSFRFQVTGTPVTLPDQMQPEILRICQESIQNSVKHANATNIVVQLHYEPSRFRMVIEDNGKGFGPESFSLPGHFGMQGMRERAAQINSRIVVESDANHGTRIELIVPL